MRVAGVGGGDEAVGRDLGDLLAVAAEAAEAGDVFTGAVGPNGDGFELDLLAGLAEHDFGGGELRG